MDQTTRRRFLKLALSLPLLAVSAKISDTLYSEGNKQPLALADDDIALLKASRYARREDTDSPELDRFLRQSRVSKPEFVNPLTELDQKILYLISGFEIGDGGVKYLPDGSVEDPIDRVGAMLGVVYVVTNRAESDCFNEKTIRDVVNAPRQFSPVSQSPGVFQEVKSNELNPGFDPLLELKGGYISFAARQAVGLYTLGEPSPFQNALFFDSNGAQEGSYIPCLEKRLEPVASNINTGSTTFYA
ncbi:MAG: cell wall hydrolase [Nanoarchaeota archaeon]